MLWKEVGGQGGSAVALFPALSLGLGVGAWGRFWVTARAMLSSLCSEAKQEL